jgi:hypothetical protein
VQSKSLRTELSSAVCRTKEVLQLLVSAFQRLSRFPAQGFADHLQTNIFVRGENGRRPFSWACRSIYSLTIYSLTMQEAKSTGDL